MIIQSILHFELITNSMTSFESFVAVLGNRAALSLCALETDKKYCQTSNISHTLVVNKSVDHSNVVGAFCDLVHLLLEILQ